MTHTGDEGTKVVASSGEPGAFQSLCLTKWRPISHVGLQLWQVDGCLQRLKRTQASKTE